MSRRNRAKCWDDREYALKAFWTHRLQVQPHLVFMNPAEDQQAAWRQQALLLKQLMRRFGGGAQRGH
jgi:hypothetical protein